MGYLSPAPYELLIFEELPEVHNFERIADRRIRELEQDILELEMNILFLYERNSNS